MGIDARKASITAGFILDLFGYDDRIIDNYLDPEDRQLFYILEEEGMLSTGREESILYDGRTWRTHYWKLKKNTILEYAKDKSKKEQVLHTKKQSKNTAREDIYNNLTEDVWEKRKIESLQQESEIFIPLKMKKPNQVHLEFAHLAASQSTAHR